jgi:hypothetical protein
MWRAPSGAAALRRAPWCASCRRTASWPGHCTCVYINALQFATRMVAELYVRSRLMVAVGL